MEIQPVQDIANVMRSLWIIPVWQPAHSLHAEVSSIPEINAKHVDAAIIHEAAIGKIAGDQLIKLMTLGLTEAEAEQQIISGFLK